jgi:hypothetical protein
MKGLCLLDNQAEERGIAWSLCGPQCGRARRLGSDNPHSVTFVVYFVRVTPPLERRASARAWPDAGAMAQRGYIAGALSRRLRMYPCAARACHAGAPVGVF